MCSPFCFSKKDLIIAYAAGYEAGHHATVEKYFYGNGRPEEHDEIASDWVDNAIKEKEFDRDIQV